MTDALTIEFNGQSTDCPKALSLAELLTRQGFTAGSFAVAVNHSFVPRHAYSDTIIKPGDSVEVVAPMQGG